MTFNENRERKGENCALNHPTIYDHVINVHDEAIALFLFLLRSTRKIWVGENKPGYFMSLKTMSFIKTDDIVYILHI